MCAHTHTHAHTLACVPCSASVTRRTRTQARVRTRTRTHTHTHTHARAHTRHSPARNAHNERAAGHTACGGDGHADWDGVVHLMHASAQQKKRQKSHSVVRVCLPEQCLSGAGVASQQWCSTGLIQWKVRRPGELHAGGYDH